MRKLLLLVPLVGCANDPMYVPGPNTLEAGMMDSMGNMVAQAKSSLTLPIKTETTADATARATLATTLMVAVPYVKIDDIAVEVEYTIKNLDSEAGQAKVELNGANELFSYDPTLFADPNPEDEAPPPPGLAANSDIPIDIAANGEIDGLFTEDETKEASVDLDMITRGNVNEFAATITVGDKNRQSFQPMTPAMYDMDGNELPQSPMGPPIPRAAFPHIIRFDLVFTPDHHMVLDYNVRIRDLRGIVDNKGVAAPMTELEPFTMIMTYMPTLPPPPS